MTTYGVNTLISDSGVIKYRIITEQWEVNPNTNPSKWLFTKGLHLQQFDQKLHVQAHIEAVFAISRARIPSVPYTGRLRETACLGIPLIICMPNLRPSECT